MCLLVTTYPVGGSYELGIHECFCYVKKRLEGYQGKWKMFQGHPLGYGSSCE